MTTTVLRYHFRPPISPERRQFQRRFPPHRAVSCRLSSEEDRDHSQSHSPSQDSMARLRRNCSCICGRRNLLSGAAPLLASSLPPSRALSGEPESDPSVLTDVEFVHASRAGWYQKLFALVLARGMEKYEKEVARYKTELFMGLNLENKKVLEMGIGTGPNLKYYAATPGVHVYGVDPNKYMEKYIRETATTLNLPQSNFKFIQGVAEALPVRDNSMDAVVGTLVLCSVNDVNAVLTEVKRVLKPGGHYIFIEHVASQDGSFLRSIQKMLDPLQQFVADGCHLARETGKHICEAEFSDLQLNKTSIPHLSLVSPHVYGIARK